MLRRGGGVILNGPSLTEGFPATNPAVRLVGFDAAHSLTSVRTYYADLHDANRVGALNWTLEYDMREHFAMRDLSPASFEALHARLAADDALWGEYRGRGAGTVFVTRYAGTGAANPPTPCVGACRAQAIATLNQTTAGA